MAQNAQAVRDSNFNRAFISVYYISNISNCLNRKLIGPQRRLDKDCCKSQVVSLFEELANARFHKT